MEPERVAGVDHRGVSLDSLRQDIRRHALADEARIIEALLPVADPGQAVSRTAHGIARQLVEAIRHRQARKAGVDALLNAYPLSGNEGLALLCLAEALLRVPDRATASRLIDDLLAAGNWAAPVGRGHGWFVNAAARLLSYAAWLTRHVGHGHSPEGGTAALAARLRQALVLPVMGFAVGMMGDHFVLAATVGDALLRARRLETRGYRHSYDMLGEGARTAADAQRYLDNYLAAIDAVGAAARGLGPVAGPGISVKLSALHPRYELLQQGRVMAELVPRLKQLAMAARARDIGLTVDAEEARRLELSLDVIEAVFSSPALEGWEGFGIAVQACQKRALPVIEWCRSLAREMGRPMAIRLVKGAYWDTEIKLAQVQGLDDYPVFTRKPATDVSYLACARHLLDCRDWLYPQFATHNAGTVAAILALDDRGNGYEFQRLHGMGEALYDEVRMRFGSPCRIYGPVGEAADLLSYLVRRVLENGANSSFVSRVLDTEIPPEALVRDPVEQLRSLPGPGKSPLVKPGELYGPGRRNAPGADLGDPAVVEGLHRAAAQCRDCGSASSGGAGIAVHNPANREEQVGSHPGYATRVDMKNAVETASAAFETWSRLPVAARARLINRFADALESHRDELLWFCVREAGRTLPDSLAEVREAVDFCRYYAQQAELLLATSRYRSRGVMLCISPWNFPLAIFTGQMIAALAVGNTVVAKPAEQTSLIARRVVDLLYQCGFPRGVVQLLVSPGPPVGEALIPDPRIRGVIFTGSTATARWLNRALALRPDAPLPLVAETGGQNAMIVDSTALPEQVVDDIIRSGFNSAGQRCSSLRVLFLQADIAPRVIRMLKGAMAELRVGDPSLPSTDVGPLIDARALARLNAHRLAMETRGELLYRCELPPVCAKGYFFAPCLYEIPHLWVLSDEVFGPVVHVIRYRSEELEQVIGQIHGTGYGLTLGIHSRNPVLADYLARRVRVGNVYINRDMIGAVVGVQPFGGRGLSGTGPKAGGPHYLSRLMEPESDVDSGALPLPVTEDTGDIAATAGQPLATAIARLHGAGAAWEAIAPSARRDMLRTVPGGLLSAGLVSASWVEAMADILDYAAILMGQGEAMPGPTGESNVLLLESRGLILSLMTDAAEVQHWLAAVLTGLMAGNSVLMAATHPLGGLAARCHRLIAGVKPAALACGMAVLAGPESLAAVVDDPRIAAATLSPASGWRGELARRLAARDGAIQPLICEPPGRTLLMGLVSEKTVAVNTTAVGGNAALLTNANGLYREGCL